MTVCIGTYGDARWVDLAYRRAMPSVGNDATVIHSHDQTLARARNEALEDVETEFVIFLDADDELEPDYIEQMSYGPADLRAPLVRYVRGEKRQSAEYPRVVGHQHLCRGSCLAEGNWIAIGACVRTELLREVGGFGDEPIWEDWSLWLRCYRAGARISRSGAVYRAHVRPEGRNAGLTTAEKRKLHAEIVG